MQLVGAKHLGCYTDDISVFKHGVTLVGSNRSQYIDDVDLNKLVWYVLNNCEEAEEYLE